MKETEIKLQYDSSCQNILINRCLEMGFVLEDQVWEEDIYYTPAHKNLMQCDQALRVRSVDSEKNGAQCRITYKGVNQAENMQMREELETDVRDGAIMKAILNRLDFSVLASVEKKRAYYKKENIHICIDQVKNLGDYFEIEILGKDASEESLQKLLRELDIPDTRIESQTYLDLILDLAQKNTES